MTRYQKKFFIKASLLVVVFVAFFCVFFIPKYLAVQKIKGRTNALFHENQRVSQIILASKNPGKRFAEIQQELEDYQRHVPQQDAVLTLLEELPSWAEAVGLRVLSITPAPDEAYLLNDATMNLEGQQEVREYVVDLKLKGTYFEISRYLRELQNSKYRVRTRKVFLNNPNPEAGERAVEPQLLVDLQLGILIRFPSKGAG